jgi:hypothetical protein
MNSLRKHPASKRFERFDPLDLRASLIFPCGIDFLQHPTLRNFQPLVRFLALDLKSCIPARDGGLQFLDLLRLSLADTLDLLAVSA